MRYLTHAGRLLTLGALACLAPPLGAATPTVLRDVVYAVRGSESLAADVYLAEQRGAVPGVLVVHGGAWTSGSKAQMGHIARKLAAAGYTAVAINYRLAPRYPFPAQIEDCEAAVRWMRANSGKLRIDVDHIAGLGYSAGGHLVALLGTSAPTPAAENPSSHDLGTRLQAVVAGGTPCDFGWLPSSSRALDYWLGGTPAEKPNVYRSASPLAFVSADDPPMLFFHGDSDRLVPLASPEAMVARLTAVGVNAALTKLSGAGHVAAFFDARGDAATIEFLDRVFKAPKHPGPAQ